MSNSEGQTKEETLIVLAAMPTELARFSRALSMRTDQRDGMKVKVGSSGSTTVIAALMGIGPEAARACTKHMLTAIPDAPVLVIGVSGGVAPELGVASLFVPEVVRNRSTGAEFRPTRPVGIEPHGILLTSSTLMTERDVVDHLRAQGVTAVDMETAGVAEVCDAAGRPWSVIRTMSDTLEAGLVDDSIMNLMRPNGGVNLMAVFRRLVRHPGDISRFMRLGQDTKRAVQVLTKVALESLVS